MIIIQTLLYKTSPSTSLHTQPFKSLLSLAMPSSKASLLLLAIGAPDQLNLSRHNLNSEQSQDWVTEYRFMANGKQILIMLAIRILIIFQSAQIMQLGKKTNGRNKYPEIRKPVTSMKKEGKILSSSNDHYVFQQT